MPSAESVVRGDSAVSHVCGEAVRRLCSALPGAEITCMARFDDVLRLVAHAGPLRVIYQIPRDFGGVAWRAVENGRTELVTDVRDDPDYIAVDDSVRSEIAVPVAVDGEVLALLNAESALRSFAEADVALVEREAIALARTLARYPS